MKKKNSRPCSATWISLWRASPRQFKSQHTRGTDPRNELYMRMILLVEVFKPKYVLIENVRGVVNAKQKWCRGLTLSSKTGVMLLTMVW